MLGRDQRAYQAAAQPGGFRLENPNNRLTTDFTAERVCLHVGTAEWRLKLQGYGYGDQLTISKPVAPLATANRVEYQRGALIEWYENGPLGLEQGFNLEQAPGKSQGEPLTVELAVSGNMVASVESGGHGLTLRKNGIPALHYSGLTAHDKSGRELRTWLDASGDRLRLRVDDAGAQYPLVIDPIVQQATLTASDGGAEDSFGVAVAVSGDTVVVGAQLADIAFGEAYVFVKPSTGWGGALTESAKLRPIDGGPLENFGTAVAISGDTVVVGARFHGAGEAYVFVKPAGGWNGTMTETATLTESDLKEGARLGIAVGVSGDTIVVGADGRSVPVPPTLPGVINVYVKPATGWGGVLAENAKLVPGVRYPGTYFGDSIGIDGDTVVAGLNNGSEAYVFVRPAAGWNGGYTENAILRASNGTPLGDTVAVSGDTVVVGASSEKIGGNAGQGAAYVYTKPATGWGGFLTETAKLTASNGTANSGFGNLVAASGDTVMALAPGAAEAYVFTKPSAGWAGSLTQAAELTAPDGIDFPPTPSIAVDGTTFAIGAPNHTIGQSAGQGWTWIYGGTPADFSLSTPALTIPLAGSGAGVTTVQSLYQFAGMVNLSVSPSVAGVTVNQSPTQATLSAGSSAASNILVSVEPYVTPRTLFLTVRGTSGTTVRSTPFRVKIVASIAGVISVVNALAAQGCIDPFETNGLLAALAKVQNYINARNIRAAEIGLADIINQIKNAGAHHFKGKCHLTVYFSPAGVLMADLKALEAALDNSRLP